MFDNPSSSFRRAHKRSSALVLTLAALVLLTSLVLVFFQLSSLNRRISFSSAGQYRADVVAHTAMDSIVGDFRSEIVAGSSIVPTIPAGTNIYLPPPPYLTLPPSRVGDQSITNLITQSTSGNTFWNAAGYNASVYNPTHAAAANSTKTASLNGRFIDPSRWNEAGLMTDPGSGSTPNLPSGYIPPDWVVMTRQGPITNAATAMPSLTTLADRTPSNLNCAVGRYAYTVYNEGALLDANVAGMPSGLTTTTFASERGLLPQVDLANLLSNTSISDGQATTDASALVTWRNAATAQTPTTYTNYVANTTNGFTAVLGTGSILANTSQPVPPPGDQAFSTRQDLINYIKNQSSIPTKALPFLTTFTRDSDGPSYYPNDADGRTVVDDNLNPNVMTILAQHSFLRPDQTTAAVGDPLLKHRFPLSRLALFQNPTGTTNGVSNSTLILKYFCMQARTDGLWDYVDPDTGNVATTMPTIKTLSQVAQVSSGREPTFWELLQAGILTGSLGLESSNPTGMDLTGDANTTRQLFKIGLSIMDQYDTDDNPTVINFGGIPGFPNATTNPQNPSVDMFVAGDENVPYVTWILQEVFQDDWTAPTAGMSLQLGYLMFGLWNPHRNANSSTPATFALEARGSTAFFGQVFSAGATSTSSPAASPPGIQTHSPTVLPFHTTTSRNFAALDLLRAGDVSGSLSPEAGYYSVPPPTLPPNPPMASTLEHVGIRIGGIQSATVQGSAPLGVHSATATAPSPTGLDFDYGQRGNVPGPFNMVLGKMVGTNFIPYQMFPNYVGDYGDLTGASNYVTVSDTEMYKGAFNATSSINPLNLPSAHSDPRTNRFGFQIANPFQSINQQMAAANFKLVGGSGAPQTLGGFIAFGSGAVGTPFTPATDTYLADYAYNNKADPFSYYTDRDGVIRQGDSNPLNSNYSIHAKDSPYTYTVGFPPSNGTLTIGTPTDAQPVMLNRPFTSVAEMGYAFRDDPWRTLNFSSVDSADGGLIDLFCLNENDASTRAGVIDINSASVELLTTLLMNAYRDPASPTSGTLSQANAVAIATAIRSILGPVDAPTMVLHNAADIPALITKLAAALTGYDTPTSSLPATDLDTFKYKREAVARALADVMNSRTWNLMIDVVAQSGRYIPSSKTLDDFVVEGERHYWYHVAIDRFTGKVISSQLESVTP
jgi:hypothetical protein